MTMSLCFRFTEFSSTLNFVPPWSASPRPYPVMLRIYSNSSKSRLYAHAVVRLRSHSGFFHSFAQTMAPASRMGRGLRIILSPRPEQLTIMNPWGPRS